MFDILWTITLFSQRAIPDHTSYCASKGAVNQITRVMAIELGPHGIRTNNVNPTVVMTKMGAKAWSDPAKSGPILSRIPLGRFAGKLELSYSMACNFFLVNPSIGVFTRVFIILFTLNKTRFNFFEIFSNVIFNVGIKTYIDYESRYFKWYDY